MLQGQTHSVTFSQSFSSLGTCHAHTFQNFKWSRIMLYVKPWEHHSAVTTLSTIILLSAQINSSTPCTVASAATSTGHRGWASSVTFECPWENTLPSCKLLYAINTSHRKQETFPYEYPLQWVLFPTKKSNITLLLGSAPLKHRHHFDYWNQPMNMHMCICYIGWHEAGLCCYLVIHIENLLHPLQLFYLHLWPIYWLSLILFTTVYALVLATYKSMIPCNKVNSCIPLNVQKLAERRKKINIYNFYYICL
jgi:hypothetical protein